MLNIEAKPWPAHKKFGIYNWIYTESNINGAVWGVFVMVK